MQLGANHFDSPLDALPRETVVWEGAPAARGSWIGVVHAALIIGLFASPFFVGAASYDSATEERQVVALDADGDPDVAAARRANRDVMLASLLRGCGAVVIAVALLLVLVGLLDRRHSWYLITTERICLQSGAFTRRLVALDLDKVVAATVTAGTLERWLGIENVDIAQPGVNIVPSSGFAGIKANTLRHVPTDEKLMSRLLCEWLPRDNPKAST